MKVKITFVNGSVIKYIAKDLIIIKDRILLIENNEYFNKEFIWRFTLDTIKSIEVIK